MAGHNDPKLLYAIQGINAYHIENGREECLTLSGPQTLSLLMVPTSSPFSDLSATEPTSAAPEEDFYLHLHLPPELDLPLPATTQIYHQPPDSYLIPRWDLGPESGAFTRIEFPGVGPGKKGSQEDVDTFETILAQCTAFLERAVVPKAARPRKSTGEKGRVREKGEKKEIKPYDPSAFKPGEAYVPGSEAASVYEGEKGGQIVLIDEENGSVVGELGEGFYVKEGSGMKAGSKDPVEITLPKDGSLAITVAPASQDYLEMAMHPAYKNSTLVSRAAMASRLIVTTSGYVSKTLQSQADTFTKKTTPSAKPMTFDPITHARIRKVHTFTEGAAGLSAKTVGQVQKYAQNLGATLHKRSEKAREKSGEEYKPGLLNKSMMAFSTIADGIDQAGRNLLNGTSTAATTVVTHKYGAEAGEISKSIGGGFKNVGLVYIDAAGVSRKAIVKSVAKGMVVGKMRGGGDLVVGGGDGGSYPSGNSSASSSVVGLGNGNGNGNGNGKSAAESWKEKEAREGRYTDGEGMMTGAAPDEPVGFGRQALPPPAYGSTVGESIEGSRAPVKEKGVYH